MPEVVDLWKIYDIRQRILRHLQSQSALNDRDAIRDSVVCQKAQAQGQVFASDINVYNLCRILQGKSSL